MKKVYVFLAEGFEEMEAVTPVDLLRRVQEGVVDVKLVSVTGDKAVTGAHGITYQADLLFEEIEDDADMLVLPGGMPGSLNLDASPYTDEVISAVMKSGGRLAAICAAPLVLGRRGLLNGKNATCFPGFENQLEGVKNYNISVKKKERLTENESNENNELVNLNLTDKIGAFILFGVLMLFGGIYIVFNYKEISNDCTCI